MDYPGTGRPLAQNQEHLGLQRKESAATMDPAPTRQRPSLFNQQYLELRRAGYEISQEVPSVEERLPQIQDTQFKSRLYGPDLDFSQVLANETHRLNFQPGSELINFPSAQDAQERTPVRQQRAVQQLLELEGDLQSQPEVAPGLANSAQQIHINESGPNLEATTAACSQDQEQADLEIDEFKILRKWPIMFMIACSAIMLQFWTTPSHFQYQYLTLSCIPSSLCDVLLWVTLYRAFKVNPRLIRVVLLVLHERLIYALYLFIMINRSKVEEEGELSSKYIFAAITNTNFLIQCIIVNTGICLKVLPKSRACSIAFILATFAQLVALQTYHFFQLRTYGDAESQKSLDIQEFILVFINNLVLTLMFYASISLNSSTFKLYTSQIVEKSKQNEQYKRMIDAIGEGMMVVQKGVLKFKNTIAATLLEKQTEERITDAKIFHIFKETEGSETSRREVPSASRILETTTAGYSINELISSRERLYDHFIFTFNEEYSKFTQMNELQGLVEKQKAAGVDSSVSFDFFLIRVFPLAPAVDGEDPEFAIELIDISQKIMMDSMNTERKYMAYMNSTISHEMRNPLNSIHSQIQVIKSRLEDHFESISEYNGLTKDQSSCCSETSSAVSESLSICQSSCKMLLFNVEDILALPRLKEGRFTKNIQQVNIAMAIDEVMSIQALQVKEKGVKLTSSYIGFEDFIETPDGPEPSHRIPIDEKRFQQVLLNYQSNALKFLNKKDGKVLILLQFVKAGRFNDEAQSDFKTEVTRFFGADIYFDQPDSFQKIFEVEGSDSIVLSVLDNGIGVKESDQSKLFKLFGCLKNTRSMNTQGIGLGLMISKMISEEFGGMTQMHSVYQTGSVFQSSFKLPKVAPLPRANSLKPEINFRNSSKVFKEANQVAKQTIFANCLEVFKEVNQATEFSYTSKKVLIIDDESFNCQAMLGMISVLKLPDLQKRVDVAYSGQEALDLVAKSPADYSVIFTDCSMPFMDGYECCRRIHCLLNELKVDQKPKILAVTGHVESEYQRKALLSGMDSLFSKPIKIEQLAMVLYEQRFQIKLPKSLERELGDASK